MAGLIKIDVKEKPRTLTGESFPYIVDTDARPVPMAYQCDKCGFIQEIVPPIYFEDPDLVQILTSLIFTIPKAQTTIKDSMNAYDFIQCKGEITDGILKMTQSLYDWLLETVKRHGPTGILGVNAVMVQKALEEKKIKGTAGAAESGG